MRQASTIKQQKENLSRGCLGFQRKWAPFRAFKVAARCFVRNLLSTPSFFRRLRQTESQKRGAREHERLHHALQCHP